MFVGEEKSDETSLEHEISMRKAIEAIELGGVYTIIYLSSHSHAVTFHTLLLRLIKMRVMSVGFEQCLMIALLY